MDHTLPPMAQLTWIGHGTALLDLDGVRLLTDPLLRDRVAHLRRHAPLPPALLQSVDAVLLTHLHRDHLDLPSLRRVGRGVPIVVPRGGGRLLLRRGFDAVREIAPGEEIALGALSVTATEARHHGGRGVVGAHGPALGYLIAGSRRVYHAGDTDLFDGMRAIGATGLDLALVPIWGWASRLGPGHLNPLRAAQALELLAPRVAVPIHWGTYAVGPKARKPPRYVRAPLEPFLAAARELAPAVQVVALEPGQSLEIS
jgi:L-ascorbate metabolism protein UlaG (beta-lactamase superfamily)